MQSKNDVPRTATGCAVRGLTATALLQLQRFVVVLLAITLGCDASRTTSEQKSEVERKEGAASASIEKQSLGVVVTAEQVSSERIERWKSSGTTVVLKIDSVANQTADRQAAEAISAAGLQLDYWIEVARCPELADAHPEWMASLQGHPEWRRIFPDAPQPDDGQVIKNYPWVPILYRESFDAHVARVKSLLQDKPPASRIWLNDLQGAPSACGCGHPLCRWTADYGPIKTATPIGQDAAAKFVAAVQSIANESEIVPIFVGECEQEDKDSVCCGVACYEGKCWKDFSKQLDALSAGSPKIGVGCFYKAFDRDLPRYNVPAGWVKFSLNSFSEMPPQRGGVGVSADRLVAVLQGWDVTEQQIQAQVERALEAKASGFLIVLCPIEQQWGPVLFDLDSGKTD